MSRPTEPVPYPGGLPRPSHATPRTLADLAAQLRVPLAGADPDRTVTGVSQDSRAVLPGDLYVARAGARTHGADYAAAARGLGAAAALTDAAGRSRCLDAGLPTLVHPHPQAALGAVSSWVYGDPARSLTGLAVTGTNGKTTTAYLLDAALRRAGRRTGLVGTVETRVGAERIPSAHTTPEAPELHALFAVMVERGADALVMEVSSLALAFGRVDGLTFDVAGFTNLSQDHLEVHGDLESYFAAKASLFTPEHARLGVVNVDDPAGRRLAREAAIEIRTVSPAGADADWRALDVRLGPDGAPSFRAEGPGGRSVALRLAVPGSFNVANGLVAVAMLAAAGVSDRAIADGLARATVPGRMERFGSAGQPAVVVDYAHTPDAVARACAAARSWTAGRLLAVLGCGGDRDQSKREPMGEAAARECDVVVVTDDNPRSEDPAVIRAAVLTGVRRAPAPGARAEEIADRGAAIRWALARAGSRDTVLVLGKGHERGQQVGDAVHPFDDRVVVAAELSRHAQGCPR